MTKFKKLTDGLSDCLGIVKNISRTFSGVVVGSVGSVHFWIVPSVQSSHSVMSDSLRPHESQHARPPCPSPSPGVHSNSRPSSQ